MPSWLSDLLGLVKTWATVPAKPANNRDLSHFHPSGLAVKQGVSWYLKRHMWRKDPSQAVLAWPATISKKEDVEGCGSQEDRKTVTRGKVSSMVLVFGHLDPLGHIIKDSVHSLQGVFSLRRWGAVVVAFHVDALMINSCQVSAATPGGGRVREAPLREHSPGSRSSYPAVLGEGIASPNPALRLRQSWCLQMNMVGSVRKKQEYCTKMCPSQASWCQMSESVCIGHFFSWLMYVTLLIVS